MRSGSIGAPLASTNCCEGEEMSAYSRGRGAAMVATAREGPPPLDVRGLGFVDCFDLYSERLLTSCLGGRCTETQKGWVSQLLPRQQASGAWIVPNEPEPLPYADYHSTMISVWALATWHRHHAS